jgi:hypothetical protein
MLTAFEVPSNDDDYFEGSTKPSSHNKMGRVFRVKVTDLEELLLASRVRPGTLRQGVGAAPELAGNRRHVVGV